MIKQIWQKEIKEELYTWKSMVWLVVASLLFSFTSYLLLTNKELSLLDQTELMFFMSQMIISIGLLIVTIDSSSTITSEFEKETAESLFLSPLRIKDFIVGKLLSALTLWWVIYIVAVPYIIVTSAGSHLVIPFLLYALILGTILVSAFIFLNFAISLFYRSSKNTLTTSLIVVLLFSIPAFFSGTFKNNPLGSLLKKINPVDNTFGALDNVLVDYHTHISQNLNFIIPVVIFFILTLLFLIYAVRVFKKQGIIQKEI
jgi:ABC-2 type transport system permease protein